MFSDLVLERAKWYVTCIFLATSSVYQSKIRRGSVNVIKVTPQMTTGALCSRWGSVYFARLANTCICFFAAAIHQYRASEKGIVSFSFEGHWKSLLRLLLSCCCTSVSQSSSLRPLSCIFCDIFSNLCLSSGELNMNNTGVGFLLFGKNLRILLHDFTWDASSSSSCPGKVSSICSLRTSSSSFFTGWTSSSGRPYKTKPYCLVSLSLSSKILLCLSSVRSCLFSYCFSCDRLVNKHLVFDSLLTPAVQVSRPRTRVVIEWPVWKVRYYRPCRKILVTWLLGKWCVAWRCSQRCFQRRILSEGNVVQRNPQFWQVLRRKTCRIYLFQSINQSINQSIYISCLSLID